MEELFSQAGKVTSASVITDKFTGKSKGFGFVEMENDDEARAAIEKFNGYDLNGRVLRVSAAEERAPRSGGFTPGGRPPGGGGAGGGFDRRPAKPKGSRRNIRRRKREF